MILLGFKPKAFELKKESLFSPKRNIRAITEEVLYFLFDQLGLASRFSNWPPVDKSSINEFKLTTFRLLEELKHSNEGFKQCPILIRKSLLDEYSGSASAERIDDLFYFLSCVVFEGKFGGEIDKIIQESDQDPALLLSVLQNESYQLSDTAASLEPNWNEAIEGLKVKYDHYSQEHDDLTKEVSLLVQSFQGCDLENQFDQKSAAMQALIEATKRLNSEMQLCISENAPYISHLQRLNRGKMDFSTRKIENFFREKSGKEYFCLSFAHKNLALDFAKVVQYVTEENRHTLREIDSVSIGKLNQESLQVSARIETVEETIEKLLKLRDNLSAEFGECSLQWSETKKRKSSNFEFSLQFPQFDLSQRSLDVEKELLSTQPVAIPFSFHSYKAAAVESSPFLVQENYQVPAKEEIESEEEDIDAKYIAIPRSPTSPSPKQITPKSNGKSRSLLKSVIKSQKGFKERLEMIKRKYQNVPNDANGPTLDSPTRALNESKELNSPNRQHSPSRALSESKELNSSNRQHSPSRAPNSPKKHQFPITSPKRAKREDASHLPPSPSPKRTNLIEELFPTSPKKKNSPQFPSLRTRNSSASPKSILEEPLPSFLKE